MTSVKLGGLFVMPKHFKEKTFTKNIRYDKLKEKQRLNSQLSDKGRDLSLP